jgi:peptidylprolyl isomerase
VREARAGDKVKVHYRGFLEDGTVFDSSREREPAEFLLGGGKFIPGFEHAVVGMTEGDTKEVSIEPEEAYGSYRKNLLFVVDKSKVATDVEAHVGMELRVQSSKGTFYFIVRDMTEDTLTLDANHPLAGKVLNFQIELLAVL